MIKRKNHTIIISLIILILVLILGIAVVNISSYNISHVRKSAHISAQTTTEAFLEQNGRIIIEFESAPLQTNWKTTRCDGSPVPAGGSGGAYTWCGPEYASAPNTTLPFMEYKLQAVSGGRYNFRIHSYRTSSGSDDNDHWNRMDGGFWFASFSRISREWTWNTIFGELPYDLEARPEGYFDLTPGIHTLQFSPHSANWTVDRLVFYKDGVNALDISLPESPRVSIGVPTATPQSNACINNSFFSITQPTGYTFVKECMQIPNQIYAGDSRFTFFVLPSEVNNIPYLRTVNTGIKDDKNLSWSLNVSQSAQLYVMYRKIPGQTVPSWISQNYTKQTDDNFSNLNQFVLRKNELGLIGVYDIYKKNTAAIGSIPFGPASDATTNAYSMYLVGVRPL